MSVKCTFQPIKVHLGAPILWLRESHRNCTSFCNESHFHLYHKNKLKNNIVNKIIMKLLRTSLVQSASSVKVTKHLENCISNLHLGRVAN
jgi:hypothetical protein